MSFAMRPMMLAHLCGIQQKSVLWSLRHSHIKRGAGTFNRWIRDVSTWSPLEAAFNTKQERKLSLGKENVGLFGYKELIDYTGFYLMQKNVEIEAEELVNETTSANRSRPLVQVFDQLSDCLCRVADMSDFIRVAHPDRYYSQAAEDACVKISGLVEKLNTNVKIYEVLKEIIESGDKFEMDSIDRRVAELFLFDFQQSGIHLPEEKRARFVKLNEDILMLGTYFMQGTHRPIYVSRSKIPDHLRNVFQADGDNVMVTGLFSDHHSELVREAAYMIYLHPDHHQDQLLESLINARNKLAKLVGFPTYAHRALRGTMGDNPERVMDFLTSLAEAIKPHAEKDFEEIKKLKKDNGSLSEGVSPWDAPYFSGLARRKVCRVDNNQLAPYFSLGSCMNGLSYLLSSLYKVKLQDETPAHGEVWSPDIHKLAVVHEKEGVLGHIYCDFFERAGKPKQDCHFTIKGGRQLPDGSYQDPMVVLMLNLPPPRGIVPSLLTPAMVENLFHECGHAIHSMLGRTRYQHVTGTRCPTDFAEVPSVLMEYFATDPRVISKFARHWQTGEELPAEDINSLCEAKKMFAASDLQLQVCYALLDQVFHGNLPLEKSTTDTLADIQNTYYSLPHVTGTAWQLRFGHFVGYGANYYSYIMSRAVASRIWHRCFKNDPFSSEMGERYHRRMLAHGGSKHPRVLVKGMLEEEPTTDMLVKALMDDLEDR